MGSDWVYHTNVRPRRKRTDGEEGNNEYRDEFKKSFDSFLEECKIPLSDLEEFIKGKDKYVHKISTDKTGDIINPDSTYHVRFLKSRFLGNPKFKRGLIEYYNPMGYFIRGPTQNNENDNEWVMEISYKIGY